MKLKIPDNNDPKLFQAIQRLANKKSKNYIFENLGKPTKSKCLGSGRANIFYGNIDREKLIEKVNKLKKIGINYDYTVNGITPRARTLNNRAFVIEELKWLETSPINTITVANYELARLAGKYCPSVDLVISFFAAVDNIPKLKQWLELSNVKNVITDVSTYRNLPLLTEMVKISKKDGVGISVIANLGCMANCARKEEHAIIKDMASLDPSTLHYAPCTFFCMKHLLKNPEEFLQLPLIRPEDLEAYERIGIESVKLVDRVQTTEWIEKVVGHYLDGYFDGNILDLTCTYTTFNIKKKSNSQVKAIKLNEIMRTRQGVLKYREMLPELMNVKIDPNYNFLACNNTCEHCSGCKDISAVKYDPERRKHVFSQLEELEKKYMFT